MVKLKQEDVILETYVKLDRVLKELDRFLGYLDDDMIYRMKIAIMSIPGYDISTVSSARKRYKPPRRIPCVCGRKLIETWWDSNKSGWFLECPKCGLRTPPVKYLNRLNETWNETVKMKGK